MAGKLAQDRHDARGVVLVGGRGVDGQRGAGLLDGDVDLTPRSFFPPSTRRAKQLGAERQVRLSITTALGSAVSP